MVLGCTSVCFDWSHDRRWSRDPSSFYHVFFPEFPSLPLSSPTFPLCTYRVVRQYRRVLALDTIDLIISLPLLKLHGIVYNVILVIVNRYSKLIRYIPTNSIISTLDLADLFFNRILVNKGTLLLLISNRGSIFISKY